MKASLHGSLVLLTLTATPLAAQDSVSLLFLPPGDAINAYDTADQINDYVVDMVVTQSSWGHSYGIAPMVKGSITMGPFFTHLLSGNSVSYDSLRDVPFVRSSYDYWDVAGSGVSNTPMASNPGTPVDTTGLMGDQFSTAFAEFGNTASNVIGGVVNYETVTPSRLYVTRVVGSVNGPDFGCDLSQTGYGGITASGVFGQRTDDFGTAASCGLQAITGNNYFKIDLTQRSAVLNIIDSLGGADGAATAWILNGDLGTHITPTMYADASGNAKLIGSTFNNEYVYENAGGTGVNYSFSHLPLGVISSRGNVSYADVNFPAFLGAGNVNGTAGLIGRDGNDEQVYLYVWGLDSAGAPSGNLRLDLPAVVTDNSTGWMSDTLPGGGPLEFANTGSQTSFRGGNGQVAVGQDQAGRMIVAATVDHPNSNGGATTNGNQLIAVARTDGATTEWTIAAHCDPTSGAAGTGKPILDGPGGNVIGRLISFETLTVGSQTGPSMTSPMIDSVGNVYFVGAVEVDLGGGLTDVGSGLVRAVYNPSSFSYELELIFDTGTAVHGQNSDTDYQISFIQIADSNSIGSEAAFSGNIRGGAYNGMDASTLDPADPRTLGGISLAVNIVYDADNDGDFEPATMGSLDESYRTMLYIAHALDCNANGVADDIDLADGTSSDLNQNGIPDECDPTIGTNYCISTSNSSGGAANIFGAGTASVSGNDLDLLAAPLPTGQPGIFFYGPDQILVPFGNGFRCIGAGATGVGRLPVENSGPTGLLLHELDNTMPPTGATQITAGSTWNFQAWFRDPLGGGAFFNLSNGLTVTFVP